MQSFYTQSMMCIRGIPVSSCLTETCRTDPGPKWLQPAGRKPGRFMSEHGIAGTAQGAWPVPVYGRKPASGAELSRKVKGWFMACSWLI